MLQTAPNSSYPQQNRTSGNRLDSDYDTCTSAGTALSHTHSHTYTHLISCVPDEALPIAGNGDELVRMIRDKFRTEQLALRVDLQF